MLVVVAVFGGGEAHLCGGKTIGFVGHHHHHHHHFHREQKRRTTRPNSSNIVIVRAKKESSTSSFDQLPEMTEDETAKKWAGESNQSPTMMVNAKESVGTNKIKKKKTRERRRF